MLVVAVPELAGFVQTERIDRASSSQDNGIVVLRRSHNIQTLPSWDPFTILPIPLLDRPTPAGEGGITWNPLAPGAVCGDLGPGLEEQ